MTDVPETVLETARVRLRLFTPDDVDALHAVLGDAELMKYYPAPFARAQTAEWIRWNLDAYERHGHGLWAMELKESDEVIGDCGLVVQEVDGVTDIEIGWHVRRDMCNQGLATEAAKACRDHAFGLLALTRLISLVRPENVPSCRVAEKIGMAVERMTVRGPGWAHRVYSMIKAEA